MEPWQSWAALVLGGGAIYCYYYGVPGLKENSRPTQQHAAIEATPTRKSQRREDSKTKRKGDESMTPVQNKGVDSIAPGSDEPTAKRKTNKTTAPVPSGPGVTRAMGIDGGDETDIKNWAADLAKLQEGSNLAPPTRSNQRQKTVRQSAANAKPEFPAAASTTLADADDEMSPAVSPALQAKFSSTDVSDMLDAPTPGPSSLRLTEPTQPKPARQQRKQASPQPQETKKQRQNRQKVEAKKLEREEQEKARRALEEKQRRTAREARGEPAKNGVLPAKVPTHNAWSERPVDGAVQTPTPTPLADGMVQDAQLLDTFDQDTTASTASSSGRAASPNSNTTSGTNWDGPLPSEEEQLRIINENDDASWSTVPSGKKNKKKVTSGANGDTVNHTGSDSSVTGSAVATANKETPQNVKHANRVGYNVLDNEGGQANSSQHPGDSDWSVV